jgi:hypothetical protein
MTKYDETRCDHRVMVHRVSSVRDGDDFMTKHLRSAWVCGARACTLDAQAWALRSGEPEVFTYAASGHSCEMCEPREAVSA